MKRYFIILLAFVGCNNSPGCFISNGDIVSQTVDVPVFNEITINDNISLELSTGPQAVSITAGKNILNNIEFNVQDESLTISNLNKCNWARKYKDITVSISHPDLNSILLLGFGKVYSKDTLKYNELTLISRDSPSPIRLVLDLDKFFLSTNNVSNIELSGYVRNLQAGIYTADGIIDAKNLIVDEFEIMHRGFNTVSINPVKKLSGELLGPGILELYYEPVINELVVKGGKLIQKY